MEAVSPEENWTRRKMIRICAYSISNSPPQLGQKAGVRAYRDQAQCGVQGIQQTPPVCLGRHSESFKLQHFPLELDAERDENENEELLQTDAAHIDVDALHLLRHGSRRSRPAAADELNDK